MENEMTHVNQTTQPEGTPQSAETRLEASLSLESEAQVTEQVAAELNAARNLASTLSIEDVQSGAWFLQIARKVVESYDRNARAAYFQKKYPGLPTDEIADTLSSVTVRYAGVAGGLSGAASSTAIIGSVAGGLTIPLFVSTIGAELLYLARIQMRLVLDMATLYEIEIDADDPEDMLMVFGYALGVAPTNVVGSAAVRAVGHGSKNLIKQTITKGTLQYIQRLGNRVGVKILQRTIIKYVVPGVSAVAATGYNVLTTKTLARIAKQHFRNRGKVTDEIRKLIDSATAYDRALPAAIHYMMEVDGRATKEEIALFRGILTRMTLDEGTPADFQKLVRTEGTVLDSIGAIESDEARQMLFEALTLMAISDGHFDEPEQEFLEKAAERLELEFDLAAVRERATDFVAEEKPGLRERTVGAAGNVASTVGSAAANAGAVASRAGQQAAKTAVSMGGKIGGAVRGKLNRRAVSAVVCATCKTEIDPDFAYCPNCGTEMPIARVCEGCGAEIEAGFTFCPRCGTRA